MAIGSVKWFNNKKSYGFIEQEGAGDIFVHHSAINMEGVRTLSEGEPVTFVIGGPRGPSAKNLLKN